MSSDAYPTSSDEPDPSWPVSKYYYKIGNQQRNLDFQHQSILLYDFLKPHNCDYILKNDDFKWSKLDLLNKNEPEISDLQDDSTKKVGEMDG